MSEDQAYFQGRADFENNADWRAAGARFNHSPVLQAAWRQGYDHAESYAGEASLRDAESGAAYERYMDARSYDPEFEREEAIRRYLEGERFISEYDPESGYERDPFMARVLAYGEEAQRQTLQARGKAILREVVDMLNTSDNDLPF